VGGFNNDYGYGNIPGNLNTDYSRHRDSDLGVGQWPNTSDPLSGSRTDGEILAYSVFVVLGPHSGSYPVFFNGAVGQEVAQMENMAAATFTAPTDGSGGVVATSGPAGVGLSTSPTLTPPATITYTPAGYNPTYAVWEITATAAGAVNATLTPATGQSIDHPIFLVDGYTSSKMPVAISVGNALMNQGVDYYATLDTVNHQLWITANRLVTGPMNLVVQPTAGPPSISSIPVYGYDNQTITITGANFTGATTVTFNGTDPGLMVSTPLNFTVNSPDQITATIPVSLDGNGTITVTTPNGSITSSTSIYLYIRWYGIPFPLYHWLGFAAALDGDFLVILNNRDQIFTSANAGKTVVLAPAPIENWNTVASSADGSTAAAASGTVAGTTATGNIYLGFSGTTNWQLSGAPTNLDWISLVISSNGNKMAAIGINSIRGANELNVVYTSANYGATWSLSLPSQEPWSQIASSTDGTKLVVVGTNGSILTSSNSGGTWTVTSAPSLPWVSVTSSADGTHLLAASGAGAPGQIYSSTTSGTSWTSTGAPSLDWLSVSISADGTQMAAVSTNPTTLLGTVYTATSGKAWMSNNLPSGTWSSVLFTANGMTALGGSQVFTAYTSPTNQPPTNQSTAPITGGGPFTQSYTNTFPTGGNKSPFTGGSVASWEYWYGLNYTNILMTNDPTMDAQGNPNSGSLKVYLPFGNAGDQGVFFGTFDNQYAYDETVTLDASYVTSLAFDIHFAPGTPLDSTGDLGSITMSIFPGSENGGDFGLFPSVTIPATATNGWFHATEIITNFIAQEPFAGLTTCVAMGFDYNSYSGYPTTPVTFWIDNVSVLSYQPQLVPTLSWATPSPIVYGTALTSAQLDAAGSVSGALVYNPPLGSVPGVSTGRVVSVTFNPADSLNYQSVSTNVLLGVSPAALTATANNASRAFAAANPAFTATYSGFVNGDTASVVSGFPSFTTTASNASAVGTTYPIVPSLGSLIASNYAISNFVNGTLTITPVVTAASSLVWAQAFVPLYYWDSLAASADGTKLFAAASGGEIYRSTNSGALWTLTSAPLEDWTALAVSADGSHLAAVSTAGSLGEGTNGAIYTSTNTGLTWTLTSAPTNVNWLAVASSSNGTHLAAVGSTGGASTGVVYTSANSGASWTSNNLPKESWAAIASSANGTILSVVADQGLIFVSTNAGSNWLATSAPTNNWTGVTCSASGSELVAVSGIGTPGREIFISSNTGATWTIASAPAVVWNGVASSPDGTQLIAISRPLGSFTGSVFTSTNAGTTWSSNNLPNASWSGVASAVNGTELLVANGNGSVYLTPASLIPATSAPTEIWMSNNVPYEQLFSVASSANGSNLVTVGENPYSLLSVVFTSTNAGVAWTNDTAPSGPFNFTSVASSSDGSKLAAGSTAGNIFVSTNAGATWTATSSPSSGWTTIASSSNGVNLIAAGYEELYTSTNAGGSWISNNVPAAGWASVASSADGTKLVAVGTLELSGAGVIYLSTNAGTTWTLSPAPNESWTAVASSADGTKIAAAANDEPILVSTNLGAAWTVTPSLLYDWSALASSSNGTVLVAASQNGQIFVSTNAGASWTLTGAPLESWVSVATSADGSKSVAVATSGQVYTLQLIPPITPPMLGISLTSSNGVQIYWPTSASGYVLQQSPNLSTTNWVNVTNTPSTNGATQSILVTPQAGSRFYRLN